MTYLLSTYIHRPIHKKCHFLYLIERPLQQFCTIVLTLWEVSSSVASR